MTAQPPDAPRRNPAPDPAMQWVVTAIMVVLILAAAYVVVRMADATFLAPLPPIATPSLPKTVVVAPSPDVRMDAALEQIGRNTAILPTWAAAYAVEQTKASGDGLATWAANRQVATP